METTQINLPRLLEERTPATLTRLAANLKSEEAAWQQALNEGWKQSLPVQVALAIRFRPASR